MREKNAGSRQPNGDRDSETCIIDEQSEYLSADGFDDFHVVS